MIVRELQENKKKIESKNETGEFAEQGGFEATHMKTLFRILPTLFTLRQYENKNLLVY